MNDSFSLVPALRRSWPLFTGILLTALWLSGCTDRDAVTIKLHARAPTNRESLHLEIDALVTGPQAGLRYKWYAVSGSCRPQESDRASTIFYFAEGVARDRVTLEVWREGHRVARGEVDVNFDSELSKRMDATILPEVQIELSTIPPREAGGDGTRADIAGKISGKITEEYRVLVYARAYDNWFIQPTVQAMHPILPDGTWKTWTHTGETYAVLVVRVGYVPLSRLDVLPPVGGYVVGRATFEGRR